MPSKASRRTFLKAAGSTAATFTILQAGSARTYACEREVEHRGRRRGRSSQLGTFERLSLRTSSPSAMSTGNARLAHSNATLKHSNSKTIA